MVTAARIISGSGSIVRTILQRLEIIRSSPVGYIGWLGHGNLGDQAMFEAAKRLFVGHELLHYSGARKERVLAAVGLSGSAYFSRVILGGGTLINAGYLGTVRTALEKGLDLITLGTGVGSNGFSEDRSVEIDEWGPLLKRFKRVGVRGPRSLQALEKLNVCNAEVVGDLALTLAEDQPRALGPDAFFALNVALPSEGSPDFPKQYLLDELRVTVQRLARLGWRPVPIAFCKEDVAPTKHIADFFGAQIIPIVTTPDDFFRRIGHCHFLIGVRLHSAVLSSCIGVPSLLVGYRDKGLDFMESMCMQDWLIDPYAARPGELSDKALQLAVSASSLRDVTLNKAHQYRNRLQEYAYSV